ISFPNEIRKEGTSSASSRPPSERREAYGHFWTELLALFKSRYPGQTNVSSGGSESWLSLSVGRSGVTTGWAFALDRRFTVELSLDTEYPETNQEVFLRLQADATSLSEEMGTTLEWDYKEGRKAQRIQSYYPQAPISVMDGEDVL